MLWPLWKGDRIWEESLNNSALLAQAVKGRKEEGNSLCTISPLRKKCHFRGGQNPTLQCQSELEQSIQMSFMNPEQLLALCKNCVDQQVSKIKQLSQVVALFSQHRYLLKPRENRSLGNTLPSSLESLLQASALKWLVLGTSSAGECGDACSPGAGGGGWERGQGLSALSQS